MKGIMRRLFAVLMMLSLMTAMLPMNTFAASHPVPGKVTLAKISAPAYNKITVNWKKASNATNYVIYYKKTGTSKWTRLATVPSSKTSYTHTASKKYSITVGQKYSYTVRGYNSKSKKYGAYNTKGLTTNTLPNTVKLSKASLNSSKTTVTVKWNKASGASHYVVYRKTGSSGWKRLATLSSSTTSYTDKSPVKGQKNIYTVRGYYSKTKSYGKYDSKGVSVSVPKPNPPHQHSYKVTYEDRTDCTKPGRRNTYTCSSCGDWYIEDLPPRQNHAYKDLGDTPMNWNNGAGQEPISNIKEITSIVICANCGEFFGDSEHWEERCWEHLVFDESSTCQAYTVVKLYAVHHLLECTYCYEYECGSFMYYRYPAWPGGGQGVEVPTVYLRPTEAQIKEMGLSPNGVN